MSPVFMSENLIDTGNGRTSLDKPIMRDYSDFDLYQVDPLTRNRTPKRSARFYSNVIQTNGASLT